MNRWLIIALIAVAFFIRPFLVVIIGGTFLWSYILLYKILGAKRWWIPLAIVCVILGAIQVIQIL